MTKLRAGGVTFLQQPYAVGEHRAVMIEGPSREAIELVEVSLASDSRLPTPRLRL